MARPGSPEVIAYVGLLFEARVAAGPGVVVVCRGSGPLPATTLERALAAGCRRIVSFGIAGGLAPDLRPGDWIVASKIVSGNDTYPTDFALSRKLLEMIPGAEYAPILGVDMPVMEPHAKRELHRAGLAAVDMESHLVAHLAARRGLAFASVRVVIDPAHRRIPPCALAGLRQGGAANARSTLRQLARSPRETFLVARLALDFRTARSALIELRRLLGPALGLR